MPALISGAGAPTEAHADPARPIRKARLVSILISHLHNRTIHPNNVGGWLAIDLGIYIERYSHGKLAQEAEGASRSLRKQIKGNTEGAAAGRPFCLLMRVKPRPGF